MQKLDNAIEIAYRKLQGNMSEESEEYEGLYRSVPHKKLRIVFSTLHATVMYLFDRMNLRLPTNEDENYYWAEESRQLIQSIEMINQLQNNLHKTPLAFEIDTYYKTLFDYCSKFLCQYRGSIIPPHTKKVELYYTIPIFLITSNRISVETPKINTINREYILNVSNRAQKDIEDGNYDSAITKCRTLLEETFCYVIELKQEEPSDSGNIGRLFNQVKQLYNMHQDRETDKRINMLLSEKR